MWKGIKPGQVGCSSSFPLFLLPLQGPGDLTFLPLHPKSTFQTAAPSTILPFFQQHIIRFTPTILFYSHFDLSAMVALTSRFVLLAALVASSTFAPLLPVVNAGVLTVRRSHPESGATGAVSAHATSIATAANGKGKELPVPPLPTSASHTKDGKDKKKHRKEKSKGKKEHSRVCPIFLHIHTQYLS